MGATDTVVRLLAQLVEGQRALDAKLDTILRVLERGRGARDAADVGLLVAIAEALGDRRFTSGHVLAHAEADLALREALVAADVTCAQELGCLFRRIEGITVAGFRLERAGDQRAGIVWRVQVCEG